MVLPKNLTNDQLQRKRKFEMIFSQQIEEKDEWLNSHHCG
jgi:hypothetical protein